MKDEHLVIERNKYPAAFLVSFQEYEELMRLRSLAAHRNLVLVLDQEAGNQGLSEEQLLDKLKEDKGVK